MGNCCGSNTLANTGNSNISRSRDRAQFSGETGCSDSREGDPQIQVQPNPLNFGDVLVASWAEPRSVTVKNVGTAPLTIQNLVTSGDQVGLRNDQVSGTTLQPNATATVGVRFRPAAAGARQGSVTIPSDALNNNNVVVNLTANGVSPQINVLEAVPFGPLGVNATDNRTIQIRNTGTAPLTVEIPTLGGTNANQFALVDPPHNATVIAAGQSHTLTASFDPTAQGDKTATITLDSDDPTDPQKRVTLTGCGVVRLVRLHLDEDRDSQVDALPGDSPQWQWGTAGRGAIALVKCGYPINDRNGLPDANGVIVERRELILRWTGTVPLDDQNWTAVLNIDRPGVLSLFLNNLHGQSRPPQGGFPPLAHNNGDIDLTAQLVNHQSLSLWMEATTFRLGHNDTYSATEADWRVTLTLTFRDQNADVNQQICQVRIAPWIMASDLEPTDFLCFKDYPALQNNPYSARIPAALNGHLPNGVNAETVTPYGNNPKAFARDVQKGGFVSSPGTPLIVLLRDLDDQSPVSSLTNRMLRAHPALRAYRPHSRNTTLEGQSGGGNFLVSPPMHGHPFGRMIYGHSQARQCELAGFFAAQRFQDPIVLDSSWLHVGHVDEYVSILPDANNVGGGDHKILLASARLGHALCYLAAARPDADPLDIATAVRLSEEARGAGRRLVRTQDLRAAFGNLVQAPQAQQIARVQGYEANPAVPNNTDGLFVHWSDGDRFNADAPHRYLADNDPNYWITWATAAQTAIDTDRAILANQLGIGHDQFVEIPLVFKSDIAGLVGLSADSVNMLILHSGATTCIVPKPFGPVARGTYLFERCITTQLQPFGATLHFVNDWADLHLHDGEIHCGTNQVPVPRTLPWWHAQP